MGFIAILCPGFSLRLFMLAAAATAFLKMIRCFPGREEDKKPQENNADDRSNRHVFCPFFSQERAQAEQQPLQPDCFPLRI